MQYHMFFFIVWYCWLATCLFNFPNDSNALTIRGKYPQRWSRRREEVWGVWVNNHIHGFHATWDLIHDMFLLYSLHSPDALPTKRPQKTIHFRSTILWRGSERSIPPRLRRGQEPLEISIRWQVFEGVEIHFCWFSICPRLNIQFLLLPVQGIFLGSKYLFGRCLGLVD